MKKTTAVLSIALAALVGALSGYWYRGEVQIAQEQAAYHAFVTEPPHVLALAPPGPPAPLISGGVPGPAPKR
jgi:hypothetical protein